MKYAIDKLEAVRSFFADEKIRIRYYADGKEVSKADATEFTVTGSDRVYEEPAQEPAQEPVQAPVAKKKSERVTKSSLLRQYVKEMIETSEFDFDTAVQYAQEHFEFKKPLARIYVKSAVDKILIEELTEAN